MITIATGLFVLGTVIEGWIVFSENTESHPPWRPRGCLHAYRLMDGVPEGRAEWILEGSQDGTGWHEYLLHWQPSAARRAPMWSPFDAPRLELQVSHLDTKYPDQVPYWFRFYLHRVLRGDGPVLALFENPPFGETPPRLLRVAEFAYGPASGSLREQGYYWQRGRTILITPPVDMAGLGFEDGKRVR